MAEPSRNRLATGVIRGARSGLHATLWMLKILLPISFATMAAVHFGVIEQLDFLLHPLMQLIGFPTQAALPLIIGMLTNIYAAIAAMVSLDLGPNTMTLMAIFLLISHNLVQESAVQGASGMSPIGITLIRLVASIVTVVVAACFLPPEFRAVAAENATRTLPTFGESAFLWLKDTAALSAKMFAIILVLMILMETMKEFDVIRYLVQLLSPLLKLMRLDRTVGFLWLTAVVFGLSYGAAIILEEYKNAEIDASDLRKLHVSIAINHSMVEDPALFLPLGLPAFWLWVPRVIMAICSVQLVALWERIARPEEVTGA